MSDRGQEVKNGQELAALLHRGHDVAANCSRCHVSVMAVGLPKLAYTFEVCSCKTYSFDHLIETVWHRTCLADHWDEAGTS